MPKSMRHLNGNLLCAVDVETTGFQAGYHDMWQIAVLPLDSEIKIIKDIIPFYMDLAIKRPENIDKKAVALTGRISFAQRQQRAADPWTVGEMFDDWFQRLKLPMYKKIVPLASNWPFDRSFIVDWIGNETFQQLFHPHFRDTMVAALFSNDLASFRVDKIEYPHVGLKALCARLGVKNAKPHDALQDCIATAECYRRLILATR